MVRPMDKSNDSKYMTSDAKRGLIYIALAISFCWCMPILFDGVSSGKLLLLRALLVWGMRTVIVLLGLTFCVALYFFIIEKISQINTELQLSCRPFISLLMWKLFKYAVAIKVTVNTFNGWQRIWLVFSIIYSIFFLIYSFCDGFYIPVAFFGWLLPITCFYLLGWSVGWVYRGFV